MGNLTKLAFQPLQVIPRSPKACLGLARVFVFGAFDVAVPRHAFQSIVGKNHGRDKGDVADKLFCGGGVANAF